AAWRTRRRLLPFTVGRHEAHGARADSRARHGGRHPRAGTRHGPSSAVTAARRNTSDQWHTADTPSAIAARATVTAARDNPGNAAPGARRAPAAHHHHGAHPP